MPSVLQEFVVKMGARGEAGRPNPPDDLALFHAGAWPDVGRDGAEMRIARPDLSGVAKLDGLSYAPALAAAGVPVDVSRVG